MNTWSIRFRLTAWYALILGCTFLLLGAGVWFGVRQSIQDSVDKDLRARLGLMREYFDNLAGGPPAIVEELKEQSAFAPAGTQYQLLSPDGSWIYRSPFAQSWNFDTPRPADLPPNGRIQSVAVKGIHLRLLSAPVKAGLLQIGFSMETYRETLAELAWALLIASPLILLLASAAGYWMSGRALKPVGRIGLLAQEISAHRLSERIPRTGSGDEFDRLSATLNEMFARLESAFQRVTQFSADASHELRTPVTIIRTAAEMALARPRSQAEHEKAWKLVLAESERTSDLLNDLMMLVRADSSSDGLAMAPMDLADSVREACEEARILARSAGLQFDADLPSACPFEGDSEGLRRLILLLLDNAIKYTPSGGAVHVGMDVRAGNPGTAVIEVRDSGIGIAAEDQPRIFDRFYRASKDRSRDRTRSAGGAGLGLSIAQWLATRHGGRIQVETALGAGSAFRVSLPIRN